MEQVSDLEATNIGCPLTKIIHHGSLASGICSPLLFYTT